MGRSHECDFPSGVEALPICSLPTIDINADSAGIHQQVEQSLEAAISIFRIDVEQVQQLKPTLILTQMQCEVCAVSEDDVRAAVAELSDPAPAVLSLSPSTLDGLWQCITSVAGALDVLSAGEELIDRLKTRLKMATEAVDVRPRVACIEWLEPLMTAGNWVPELIEAAGGENVIGETGAHSPWLEWSTLLEADPDVLLVFPCGFTLERTRSELTALTDRPEWQQLRAVHDGNVFLIDGHHYLNRPGPRLVDSAEIIAEILHPSLIKRSHHGTAWSRCDRH